MHWVAVTERLPEEGERVLAWLPADGAMSGEYAIGQIDQDGDWCDADGLLYTVPLYVVSHWMPLPGPPEAREL